MKSTQIIALVLSAMTVTAVPMADLDAAEPAAVEIEARDLTKAQCKGACDRGADAVEAFCRLVPDLRVRAACWGAATAAQSPIGQRA
ncbi:MAG: hypothetical protein Q9217_003184, partial [Psora testacea]